MSATTTRHASSRRDLLRHANGVELPAAGTWTVPPSHATVEFTEPRRLRRDLRHTGRARESVIVLSDHPGDAVVTVVLDDPHVSLADGGRTGRRLVKLVVHSDSGPQPWMLTGCLIDSTEIRPVRATLSYNGVWRRGDRPYGWFVLNGEVGERAGGGTRMRFRFELLALSPQASSSTTWGAA